MGDLVRGYNEIEANDKELMTSWLKIQISEKKNQMMQLTAALDKLKTVDMKKIEHQMKVLEKEVKILEDRLTVDNNVIDVKP
jgi:hypothetical protein